MGWCQSGSVGQRLTYGMMLGCVKFVKGITLGGIWTVRNKRLAFHIKSFQHSPLMAVAIATSSAAEHRCRRLDGKVAVITASTAGLVCSDSFRPRFTIQHNAGVYKYSLFNVVSYYCLLPCCFQCDFVDFQFLSSWYIVTFTVVKSYVCAWQLP